jgi:hypothetical protein
MTKEVNFIPANNNAEISLPHPKPSKKYFADWFKDMPGELPTIDGTRIDKTAKHCMPFIDAISSGYTQELICDLEIKNLGKNEIGNDIISYTWAGDVRPCSTREEETNSKHVFPNFDGYYNTEFHWNTQWEPQTPKGYSTIYFHPANRFDLPFQSLTGIIDTDKWSINGPLPFLIKKGFEGIIPAGTPIYQMIFIKRDNWVSKASEYNEKFNRLHFYNSKKVFSGGYKKRYWEKKNYE